MSDLTSLLIGIFGAITGFISLGWHIFNSRSKVVLEIVSFTRERGHNRKEKEVISAEVNIRNIGNRATTIEDIEVRIGNNIIPTINHSPHHIAPNSSEKLVLYNNFTPKEFKDMLKEGEIELGITIVHTFGILRKRGHTDFSTDWLNM